MLSFDEALERVLKGVPTLASERVALNQASGRVLAQDLVAPTPLPPHDYSAVDGYAVRVSDFSGTAPFRLPIVGESRTGHTPEALAPKSVIRIFTGALLPEGADSVVIQEVVSVTESTASFDEQPPLGDNVRRRGEDLDVGGTALSAGTRLGAFSIGLAAALDQAELTVHRRPRVTVMTTGDELRPPGSPAKRGTIPESNGPMIASLVEQAGADVTLVSGVLDEPAALDAALEKALAESDLLVSIGGVSVGKYDEVRPALERQGVTLDFWKVKIKPGKPLVFGRRKQTFVLGLPGNPVSAGVTFCLFGLPLLRTLGGETKRSPSRRQMKLTAPLRQRPGRLGFYRGVVEADGVRPLSGQSSGSVTSLAWADVLIVVPEDSVGYETGQTAEVLWLSEL